MTNELAKKLYKAGFLGIKFSDEDTNTGYKYPTLSELIEACGDRFGCLHWNGDGGEYTNVITHEEKTWLSIRRDRMTFGHGDTPEEAVAELWLKLNEK